MCTSETNIMPWIDTTKSIPITNIAFQEIVSGLVFNCPSSTVFKVAIGVDERGKTKYKYKY